MGKSLSGLLRIKLIIFLFCLIYLLDNQISDNTRINILIIFYPHDSQQKIVKNMIDSCKQVYLIYHHQSQIIYNNISHKMATKSQINAAMAGVVLQKLGFQIASETIIPQILNQIQPTGGTAFRDALMGGCNMLINLHKFLQETGQGDTWNLVHVILTDGDDAGSKTSLMDAVKVMYVIGQLVNVKMLKIIFIGVGVSQKAQQEMQLLAKAGGENAEYYSASDANIGAIFQRITVKLGLEKRQNIIGVANNQGAAFLVHEEINPFLAIERQSFAVLFNLDVSGSMSGQKWSSVCQSVSRFTNFLGDNDIIAAMVFNHEAKLLANMSPNDELFPRRLPSPKPAYSQQQYYQPPRQERALGRQEKSCYCQLI